jgi:hypothetical protein
VDWFIFARSARSAETYHVDCEGYEDGDASAELIAQRCDNSREYLPRHATIEDLANFGFEVLKSGDHGRSVRLHGRIFVEGILETLVATMEDDRSEAMGEGRKRGTLALDRLRLS